MGLDCSGLVVVAYRAVGVALPRTTYDQARIGLAVTADQLAPGDLVFLAGPGGVALGHMGIYAGGGQMVVAPHTGAVVRLEPVPYGRLQLARRILGSAR